MPICRDRLAEVLAALGKPIPLFAYRQDALRRLDHDDMAVEFAYRKLFLCANRL